MAQDVAPTSPTSAPDSSNYEIIRARLLAHARELAGRAEALNTRRQGLFGSTQLTLLGSERVRTENNCVPRDIVQVGGRLLFGYNVFIGLRTQIHVADVFSLQDVAPTEGGFQATPVAADSPDNFLSHPQFQRDFAELYQYYKETQLVQLRRLETRLFMVFRTSVNAPDARIFRWAIDPGEKVSYIDNRGEREFIFPPTHDFEWTRTGREHHVRGRHPHVNILDTVFVETTGGDLTIKVENNTEAGQGIYAEPVEDRHQSLDDAEISYAKVGTLILLRIRPYREQALRYLVFNTRSQQVQRLDAIGQSCQQLPEDHGIIFPGGYYLQDGTTKTFDGDVEKMVFKRLIKAPNGEDALYVFHEPMSGRYALLPYNLIRKEVASPLFCSGWARFLDGRLVIFRSESLEPTRVHPMQIWQSPFVSDEHAATQPRDASMLGRVGNAELVRGISDCLSIRRLVLELEPTAARYEDLIKLATRALDTYHWLSHEEAGDLAAPLKEIRSTTTLILDEFEKVTTLRKRAQTAIEEAATTQATLAREMRPESWTEATAFVEGLARLRAHRGHILSLKELRYIDGARLEALEKENAALAERLSGDMVQFLLKPGALGPWTQRIEGCLRETEAAQKTPDLVPIRAQLQEIATNLDLLTEVAGALKVEDPQARSRILEDTSEVFAQVNRARALVEARGRSLLSAEGVAQFGAEFKLFGQAVASSLTQADSPERCDDLLSRLMVQLTQLESRYSEFEQFVGELATRREEVFEAFEGRKQALLEERQRKAATLMTAAERILKGIVRRAQQLPSQEALLAFFASDPMVMKVGDLATQLAALGDSVKSDELGARLKASREEAVRALRDKLEMFDEGDKAIKLGRHRFSVNTQPLELTLLPREDRLFLHLTGTEYFEAIDHPELEAARPFWDQGLTSESAQVYRGEYLAYTLLQTAERGEGLDLATLGHEATDSARLLARVRAFASARYEEGYERGIHDADAALILATLAPLYVGAGLLRYPASARALALLYLAQLPAAERARIGRTAANLGRLRATFGARTALDDLAGELTHAIGAFAATTSLPGEVSLAGAYLAEELTAADPHFALSREGARLRELLLSRLDHAGGRALFEEDLEALRADVGGAWRLVTRWLVGLVTLLGADGEGLAEVVPEAAAALLVGRILPLSEAHAPLRAEVSGLLGAHGRVKDGKLSLSLPELLARLAQHTHVHVPGLMAWRATRARLLEEARTRLRLDEFKPRVLTSFVRNRLINEVYLPLIGDNLAKQMGAAGDKKRTDLMGILLLISPPGYGKTTLMEYVASRLGLVFMKVNGPALGHEVTSIDPAEAPNATARQEVEKINLALEMGSNVMLYLDDIQHTNPELLQKFISLCDAQRRIEGVWRGRTRTYDLRGKKFCVVMAGNPYTESGTRFQIPDMLANRADTYNLGDILEGKDELFALSYLENSLTSNAALAPLASREPADVHKIIAMAGGESIASTDLAHPYTGAELAEMTALFRHMFQVQRVLLKVNLAYIASASMDDAYRTEPPFKLQGSYRNMNKLTEKLAAAMTGDEVERLVDDHYTSESQNLTTGAEQNLLKLAELRGRMKDEQRARWGEIKKGFARNQLMGGKEEDPVTRLMGPLASLVTQVQTVGEVLARPHGQEVAAQIGGVGLRIDALGEALKGSSEVAREISTVAGRLEALEAALRSPTEVPARVGEVAQRLEALEGVLRAGSEMPTRVGEVAQRLEDLKADAASIHGEVGRLVGALFALGSRIEGGGTALEPVLGKLVQVTAALRHTEQQENQALSTGLEGLRQAIEGGGGGDVRPALAELSNQVVALRLSLAETLPALAKHLDLIARILFQEWKKKNPDPTPRRAPRA